MSAALTPRSAGAQQEPAETVPPEQARGVVQSDEQTDETLWIPRVLFAVPRLVFDAVTLPLVGLAALEDEHQLVERAEDLFFNDERTFGVFPTAFIETGNTPNVGLRVLHRDLLGDGERMRLRAGYAHEDQQVYEANLRTGRVGERTRLAFGGGYRREDRGRFHGLGNADAIAPWRISSPIDPHAADAAVQTEYFVEQSWLEASGTLQPEPHLAFTVSEQWRNREIDVVPGEPGEPALDEAYDVSKLVGLGKRRSDFVVGLEMQVDTRISRRADMPVALPAAGWLLSGAVERQMRMRVVRSDFSRVRVDLNRYIDVYRGDRVLRLRLRGEWVIGELDRIAFPDLATLGGHELLRGYGRGRFRDRASALGQRAGIEPRYHRNDGTVRETSDATYERLLSAMGIDASNETQASDALASWDDAAMVASRGADDGPRCTDVGGARQLGLSAQLYAVRRDGDMGAGDFGTLRALVDWAGENGAAFVGINPLHALDLTGQEPAPYSPWSRLYLHALYADLAAVPELRSNADARPGSLAPREDINRLRAAERIDHRSVLRLKLAALQAAHRAFVERQEIAHDARGEAFAAFVAREGPALEDFARFAAIALHLGERDSRRWPRALQEARGEAVATFSREHSEAVDLHRYIQFELDRQLAEVATHARHRGLAHGLYLDLAVGSTQGGAEAWSQPHLFAHGASLGAPPDAYATEGQTWSLVPLVPSRLHAGGLEFFTTLIEHAMRHAGMLRIDHAMGLRRQFWVPDGCPPSEGAYVCFPELELFDRVALTSQRHQCVVVGEDLGTVPEGFREEMARRGMLRSLVLYFERQHGGAFSPPARYARSALASANTHDLPTLRGFWQGADIDERCARGGVDDAARQALRDERSRDCNALLSLLRDEGLFGDSDAPTTHRLCRGVYELLARTPSSLLAVALEDLGDELHAANLPGAPDPQRVNWTRRMQRSLETMASDTELRTWLQGLPLR